MVTVDVFFKRSNREYRSSNRRRIAGTEALTTDDIAITATMSDVDGDGMCVLHGILRELKLSTTI